MKHNLSHHTVLNYTGMMFVDARVFQKWLRVKIPAQSLEHPVSGSSAWALLLREVSETSRRGLSWQEGYGHSNNHSLHPWWTEERFRTQPKQAVRLQHLWLKSPWSHFSSFWHLMWMLTQMLDLCLHEIKRCASALGLADKRNRRTGVPNKVDGV